MAAQQNENIKEIKMTYKPLVWGQKFLWKKNA